MPGVDAIPFTEQSAIGGSGLDVCEREPVVVQSRRLNEGQRGEREVVRVAELQSAIVREGVPEDRAAAEWERLPGGAVVRLKLPPDRVVYAQAPL